MKLYRTELDKELNKKLFDIDTNQFLSDELNFFEDKIPGVLSIDRNSNGYHIRGSMQIPFEQTCDRCLTKFHNLKKCEFSFWLTDNNDILQDDSNEIIFLSKNANEIDLSSSFRELILLEQQMKSLCREDCKGLCSHCGADLNNGNCACPVELGESPWEALKNLKGTA